jgi:hypothetical protein
MANKLWTSLAQTTLIGTFKTFRDLSRTDHLFRSSDIRLNLKDERSLPVHRHRPHQRISDHLCRTFDACKPGERASMRQARREEVRRQRIDRNQAESEAELVRSQMRALAANTTSDFTSVQFRVLLVTSSTLTYNSADDPGGRPRSGERTSSGSRVRLPCQSGSGAPRQYGEGKPNKTRNPTRHLSRS